MAENAPEQIMADYRAAYLAANGGTAPDIRYENGWYRVGRPSSAFRKSKVLEMTARLNKRAAESPA